MSDQTALLSQILTAVQDIRAELGSIGARSDEHDRKIQRLLDRVFGNGGTSVNDRLTKLEGAVAQLQPKLIQQIQELDCDEIEKAIATVKEWRKEREEAAATRKWAWRELGGSALAEVGKVAGAAFVAWMMLKWGGTTP